MTSPGAAALAAAAAAAPVHALSEMAMDRIWLLASTLPMMNYVKAEMVGLGKKVTAIHACVLMSSGCLYENKDAEKRIYSNKLEIDDFVKRVPTQTRFPQICQRLVESTRRLRMRTNCSVINPGPPKTPPHTVLVRSHLQLLSFMCSSNLLCANASLGICS